MMTAIFSCRQQQQDTRQKIQTRQKNGLNVNCCLYIVGRRRPASEMQPRRDTDGRQLSPNQLWRAGKSLSLSQIHLAFAHIRGVRILSLFLYVAQWCCHTHLRDRENHHLLLTSSSCVLAKWSAGERWREKAAMGISAKERERKPFHIPQIRCVYCQKLTEGTDAATTIIG